MKVLMFGWEFPPHNSGGLGVACKGLTKGLVNCKAEVTFVLPRKVDLDVDYIKVVYGDEETSRTREYYINSLLRAYNTEETYLDTLSVEELKKRSMYGATLFDEVERYGEIAADIASQEEFDIIHAHDWLTAKAAIAAKRVTGKNLVLHIHATEFDRSGHNGVNQRVYDIEREGMHAADAIVAVSNLTKNTIVKHYGVDPDKVHVVHNAIEFEDYALEELHRIHRLRENKKIVLFLGRITLQKGPEYFVHAAKKVLEHYPDVVFVFAGSGDMEKRMIRMVSDLGIADKFIFTGFLRGRDTYKAYRMADLFVMPSVSEPFGLVPLESMKTGTPALISHQSGVAEVLTHCLKSDFWDTDELANKIVSVLRYPALHRCLQNNGVREVDEKKFNWDSPAQRCVDIYNKLQGKKN